MKVRLNSRQFEKDMKNVINYSLGFIEGVNSGKKVFLDALGQNTTEMLKEFIDANARVNPEMLHHMYEWNQSGSPAARLYDIDYTVSNLGLSVKSSFRQSSSVQNGSNTPFYDKARIMEQGIPVVIKPKLSEVLSFDVNGEQVFTKSPVRVANPGGENVEGGFEKTFDTFFRYFSQSFLRSSGIAKYLEKPVAFKSNLPAGKRGGRSVGKNVGYRWIVNAGMMA